MPRRPGSRKPTAGCDRAAAHQRLLRGAYSPWRRGDAADCEAPGPPGSFRMRGRHPHQRSHRDTGSRRSRSHPGRLELEADGALYGRGAGRSMGSGRVCVVVLPVRVPGVLRHRSRHHPCRVRLRRPLEAVGGVAHPESVTVVPARDRALPLLDDMRQLMGQRAFVGTLRADDDVLSRGVGTGSQLCRRASGGGVAVHLYPGEVRAEPGFQLGARVVVEGAALRPVRLSPGRP